MTLCLGHDINTKQPNGCPKCNECQRHVALWARDFPDSAPIVGTVCSSRDYMLFLPVEPQQCT